MNEIVVIDNSVDFAVGAWLHEKKNRTDSKNTERVYGTIINEFRRVLRRAGTDLDGDSRTIALCLQAFAGRSRNGSEQSAAAFNQRVATVSSFYKYCQRTDLLGSHDNPAVRVERKPNQRYRNAQPLDAKEVRDRLAAINGATLADRRDKALLLIALTTGRRLSELATLKWGNVTQPRGEVVLTFPHAKGGKVMRDKLAKPVARALLEWKKEFTDPTDESPVWLSLSRNRSFGNQLSVQGIEQMCERRLGTSRFHALRHTFAHAMEEAGAKVSDIQARLGHSNIATTGIYLASLRSEENAFADEITSLFVGEE